MTVAMMTASADDADNVDCYDDNVDAMLLTMLTVFIAMLTMWMRMGAALAVGAHSCAFSP